MKTAQGLLPNQKVLVHGHRGSRGTHPENTLPAFKEALEADADILELDLQLSKDNVVIVSHDPVLDAHLCRAPSGQPVNPPIPIRSLSAREVARYDCGSTAHPNFPEQKLFPHTPKPTLDEVLAWAKSASSTVQFNIETKMEAPSANLLPEPDLFAGEVLKVLHRYHLVDRTILQSFDPRTLEAAKRKEPKLRLSFLFEKEKDFPKRTKALGAGIASPQASLVTPELVQQCHQYGIEVHPWTINEASEWERLIQAGVDGIITDYPRKLVTYLKEHKSTPKTVSRKKVF